jgi:type VI secretion system protein ImpJ
MATRAVHWHEGMFLRPQHFQAADRYGAHQRAVGSKWDLHYNWGLRSIDVNMDALANHRLVVQSLRARLRDGTLVSLPEDAPPNEVDLREPLESRRELNVLLAVPVLRVGRANVAEDGQPEAGRFLLDAPEIEDENTGQNPQPLQVRRLNVRLLVEPQQEKPGYEVLPIARIQKSADAAATPCIDTNYIPPVLACDAWQILQIGILQAIYDRIGRKSEVLARLVESRGIGVESYAGEDFRIIAQLRALNEAYTVLNVLAFADGIHPLEAYAELSRLVGQLSIFGQNCRPPDLPRYDHDDLGRCFYAVKKYIDALLEDVEEPDFEAVPFRGEGLRMQVGLKSEWLESAWQPFVGVKTTLPADQCINLLTAPGQLDMKIGSHDRVDRIFELGQTGLRFSPKQAPRSLPPGLVYFQVDRLSQVSEWDHVRRVHTLAIRLNERRILGNIKGEQTLTISHGGQNATLSFILYLVRSAQPVANQP